MEKEPITVSGLQNLKAELEDLKNKALIINEHLVNLFSKINIELIDFKIEFGRYYSEDGNSILLLADEISPDNCRLWDIKTNKKMDKDLFRQELGGLKEAYQEVANRLGVLTQKVSSKLSENKFSA